MSTKAYKIKSAVRGDKVVLTAYRQVARGRKAIHGRAELTVEDLRNPQVGPPLISKLIGQSAPSTE